VRPPRGGNPLRISFYGVRGSTPCPCEANSRYGGNTACVALEVPGEDPIVFDLGTGLRLFGETQAKDGTFRGTALVTHIHWDHTQGLPFFVPALRAGAILDIYGPVQEDGLSLAGAFDEFMRPPFFPVRVSDLPGAITFHDVADTQFALGNAKVTARSVPHVGVTNGYRVDWDGGSVAYISDHQSPQDGDVEGRTIADNVLELAQDADVLIHDAQYWLPEWQMKSTWGHCTVDYAIHVAQTAGVKTLVLFHHDPAHDDAEVDRVLAHARTVLDRTGIEPVAAYEGLTISLD
jgi:phosphoribosyl 1,2-cyclic phosphodiesterase